MFLEILRKKAEDGDEESDDFSFQTYTCDLGQT